MGSYGGILRAVSRIAWSPPKILANIVTKLNVVYVFSFGIFAMQSLLSHSVANYEALVDRLLNEYPPDIAMARAIGCKTLEEFEKSGDLQVDVLRHHGLNDGMSIYDLGCGSGRTAYALLRSGWKGQYKGADIIRRLVIFLNNKCEGYHAVVNQTLTILAPDNSVDIVFHWSVFTHIFVEECFLYLQDIFRSLKPGGKTVFSFLELENESHRGIFKMRVENFRLGQELPHLDTFLHRDWIRRWAAEIGFAEPEFTDGTDNTHHRQFWQTLVTMIKPQAA
jgi:SAM-dependent methyltransferase